jgi:hypothetical protein
VTKPLGGLLAADIAAPDQLIDITPVGQHLG